MPDETLEQTKREPMSVKELVNLPIHTWTHVVVVVQIRSRAKIEKIRASLFNSSDLIGLSSLDGEDELMEMSTEEILTVSTVNQSLFDTQGSPALEDYLNDKTLKGRIAGKEQGCVCVIWLG